jgi:hypothetical protein
MADALRSTLVATLRNTMKCLPHYCPWCENCHCIGTVILMKTASHYLYDWWDLANLRLWVSQRANCKRICSRSKLVTLSFPLWPNLCSFPISYPWRDTLLQFKVFPHLTTVSNLAVKFPPFKILSSLVPEPTTPQRNLILLKSMSSYFQE